MGRTIRTCSAAVAAALVLENPAQARGGAEAFVRARAAEIAGDDRAALAAYAILLRDRPEATVALRAYRAGLRAGDLPLIRDAVAALRAAAAAPPDADLFVLADATARGDRRAGDAALDRLEAGPFAFMVPLLRAWENDPAAGAALAASKDALTRRYAMRTQALVLIGAGQADAGLAMLRAATPPEELADANRAAARLLLGRGDRHRAQAIVAGRLPLAARSGLKFGLADTYLRIADDLRRQMAATLPIALARSALVVDPTDERARLILAEALIDDGAFPAAAATLNGIADNGPFADAARGARLRAAAARGDRAAVLADAAALAARPDASAETLVQHGDYLSEARDFAGAARAYRAALTRAGAAATAVDLLRLGDALDRAGRWDEARTLLDRALALAPDDPDVLNAVGYARLERRADVSDARALLKRAHRARPNDRAIQDSVGWAYVLTGQAAQAVPLLEQAIAGGKADAVIAGHLGDAYWAVGRRFEARNMWRAAATATDDPVVAASLADRIAQGLPARP